MNSCSDGDEFPRAVAKTAVSQIGESAGFHSIQRSALEALADIAIRYLNDIGKASNYYANLAGRTESNALDVISALEDIVMGSAGGGFADIHRPASSSGTLKELMRFVQHGEEIPFAKPLPHFPISKRRTPAPSFSHLGENPPYSHIPSWLPAFPDPHTYRSTPVWRERKSDPRMDKLEQARQRRRAERSLVSLHLRLCSSGASPSVENAPTGFGTSPPSRYQPPLGASISEQEGYLAKPEVDGIQGKAKGRRPVAGGQNPFLAPPLPADAKDVSALVYTGANPQAPTPKKKIEGQLALPSVLDAFLPALEAARHGLEQDGGAVKRSMSVLPDAKERQPVLLSFDFGRRASHKAITARRSLAAHHVSPPGKDRRKGRVQSKEEEKDEKKRRAEQILAQITEGTEDVGQM